MPVITEEPVKEYGIYKIYSLEMPINVEGISDEAYIIRTYRKEVGGNNGPFPKYDARVWKRVLHLSEDGRLNTQMCQIRSKRIYAPLTNALTVLGVTVVTDRHVLFKRNTRP